MVLSLPIHTRKFNSPWRINCWNTIRFIFFAEFFIDFSAWNCYSSMEFSGWNMLVCILALFFLGDFLSWILMYFVETSLKMQVLQIRAKMFLRWLKDQNDSHDQGFAWNDGVFLTCFWSSFLRGTWWGHEPFWAPGQQQMRVQDNLPPPPSILGSFSENRPIESMAHTIHVWYIHLHLVDFYGKCR